jgi:hypothetical protein
MKTPGSPPEKWEVGRCMLYMEQSDLLHMHHRGRVSIAEVEGMKEILHMLGERLGRFDVLMSLVELEPPMAGAHRAWVDTSKPYLFRHAVVYGPLTMRMTALTVHRAGTILAPSFFEWTLECFPTEAEARARLDAKRALTKAFDARPC